MSYFQDKTVEQALEYARCISDDIRKIRIAVAGETPHEPVPERGASKSCSEPCEFCRDDSPKPFETDEMDAEITQVTPFPAVCLESGKVELKADPPFYAIRISYKDDEYCMEDIVPIKFCPKCGRKLVSTRTYESIVRGRGWM